MLNANRKSWIVAAVATAGLVFGTAGALVTSARAEQTMREPMVADAALEEAAMRHAEAMKKMVSEPAKMEKAQTRMAKAMVMDQMTKMLANDPKFQQMAMSDMEDPKMKTAHDTAKAMAEDPVKMKAMMEQIEKDPEAMTIISHNAAMMAMHKTGMGEKVNAMGDKMMDKMK